MLLRSAASHTFVGCLLVVLTCGFQVSPSARPLRRGSGGSTSTSCGWLRLRCSAGEGQPGSELVSIPVDPIDGSTSRQTKFTAQEVASLHELRHHLLHGTSTSDGRGAAAGAAYPSSDDLPGVVILPSWRQHVVQYDGLRAALGQLGLRSTVAEISDGLWAYSLKRLGVRQVRTASKQRALGIQVMYAMHPMFKHLEDTFEAACAASGRRPLLVLASDDSSWVVRAFLNHRETVLARHYPILAAVFLGSHQYSYAGSVALDIYPPAAGLPTDAASEVGSGEQNPAPPPQQVPCFSLNLAPAAAAQQQEDGRGGSGRRHSSGAGSGGGAAVAQIACVSLDDVEECVIGSSDSRGGGGEVQVPSGSPWLCSADMLRVWLPKVLGRALA